VATAAAAGGGGGAAGPRRGRIIPASLAALPAPPGAPPAVLLEAATFAGADVTFVRRAFQLKEARRAAGRMPRPARGTADSGTAARVAAAAAAAVASGTPGAAAAAGSGGSSGGPPASPAAPSDDVRVISLETFLASGKGAGHAAAAVSRRTRPSAADVAAAADVSAAGDAVATTGGARRTAPPLPPIRAPEPDAALTPSDYAGEVDGFVVVSAADAPRWAADAAGATPKDRGLLRKAWMGAARATQG
jgi:hypothetical protein